MVPYHWLARQMEARMLNLSARFTDAADLLLERGDLQGALAILTPLMRPDGHLDPMRAHAAAGHFHAHPSLEPLCRALVGAPLPDTREIADILVCLGEVPAAQAMYRRLGDTNAVAVCYELLDQPEQAEPLFPLRYHLALFYYMHQRLPEALAEFQSCPTYRDAAFFIDWIRHHLGHPKPPTPAHSLALRLPHRAYGSL